MLKVPQRILDKLICAHCGDYLSVGPIALNENSDQVCGRCYRIMTEDKRTNYVQQIGLEAVAELLIFPCRYYTLGCLHTFQFNNENGHEATCPFRYNTLPLRDASRSVKQDDYVSRTKENPSYESPEIQLTVNCKKNYKQILSNNIKLSANIKGKGQYQLSLVNNITPEIKHNISINLEILILIDDSPQIGFSYVTVQPQVEEPIYESVSSIASIKCVNCQQNVLNIEVFHCAFGHCLCRFCTANLCVICGHKPSSEAQSFCKNHAKGCTSLFGSSDVRKHEIDCEFNNFPCPLDECPFVDSLLKLGSHVSQVHKNKVVNSNEMNVTITHKDQNWLFFCYSKLFYCRYFNFYDRIEFIVEYIGSNDSAASYKYKVTCLSEKLKNVKSNYCLGWNEVFLNKGIVFDVCTDRSFKSEIHIEISNVIK